MQNGNCYCCQKILFTKCLALYQREEEGKGEEEEGEEEKKEKEKKRGRRKIVIPFLRVETMLYSISYLLTSNF